MNNKPINEFGFRRIWRIRKISEGVIHRGPPYLICLILHILRKPNSLIANLLTLTVFSVLQIDITNDYCQIVTVEYNFLSLLIADWGILKVKIENCIYRQWPAILPLSVNSLYYFFRQTLLSADYSTQF